MLCFLLSIYMWLIGMAMRAAPKKKDKQNIKRKRWLNKSYNLAVRATNFTNTLAEFQVDEDLELSISTRKHIKIT